MNSIKYFFFGLIVLIFNLVNAQIGVGVTTPHTSSLLHIGTNNKGLLLPRLSLSGRSDASTISNPANALLVYNRAAAGSGINSVVANSLYFRQLNTWQKFSSISEIAPLKFSNQFVLGSMASQILTTTQLNSLNSSTTYEVPVTWASNEVIVDNPNDIELMSDNQTILIKTAGSYRVLSNYSFSAGRAVATYNSNFTSVTFSVMLSKDNGATWTSVSGSVLPFDNGTSNLLQTIILPRTILKFDANDRIRITISKPVSGAPNFGEGGTNTGISPKVAGDNTKLWRLSRLN